MNPRFKIAMTATVMAASLSLANAAPADEPADGFVYDAITAPATVSYVGTVEVVGIGDRRSEASVYRIEHRAPNLTQRFYMSPPSLRGDSVVTRGGKSFTIDVRRQRVVQTENDAANDQIARDDNYLLLRANYRALKRSTESFDGRDVRVIALINKYTGRTTMLVRVDQQTKLVLDKQRFASNGSMISEVRFENVRFTTNIPDQDFAVPSQFAIVKGPTFGEASKNVDEVVRGTSFGARDPKFLPDGFSPVEGHVIDIKGVPTLHLLYSDGIRTVSLFENAAGTGLDLGSLHPQSTTIAGHEAWYVEQGPMTLLTWNGQTLHCALVGDLRLDELARIAASLAP
jgi:negative regulator of sigma E activity